VPGNAVEYTDGGNAATDCTLQDILQNKDIHLDEILIASLVFDLLKVSRFAFHLASPTVLLVADVDRAFECLPPIADEALSTRPLMRSSLLVVYLLVAGAPVTMLPAFATKCHIIIFAPVQSSYRRQTYGHVPTFPASGHCYCCFAGSISHPAKGRRPSWPKWLVTYQDGTTHLRTNRARRRVTSMM